MFFFMYPFKIVCLKIHTVIYFFGNKLFCKSKLRIIDPDILHFMSYLSISVRRGPKNRKSDSHGSVQLI